MRVKVMNKNFVIITTKKNREKIVEIPTFDRTHIVSHDDSQKYFRCVIFALALMQI
jgi:hypothetical protein